MNQIGSWSLWLWIRMLCGRQRHECYELNWFMDSGAMNQGVSRGSKDRESNRFTVSEAMNQDASWRGRAMIQNWLMVSGAMTQN